MNRKTVPVGALLFLLLLTGNTAGAFQCNVNVTGLAFGTYGIFSSVPTDGTATVEVSCNIPPQHPDAPLAVTLALSPGASGNFAQRQMQQAGGSDMLDYNLYTTPSFSTIWGDGSGSSATLSSFVTRDTPWRETIYGRIPPGQNVPGGTYGDFVTVTVLW